MYRELNADQIRGTIERLGNRIADRFPRSGLHNVANELVGIAREAESDSTALGKPYVRLRILVGAAIAVLVAVVILGMLSLRVSMRVSSIGDLTQAIEAGVNDLVFMTVALYFLLTLENRIKRRRALKGLHALRCVAHVIDMHQLTKDPTRVTDDTHATPASPERELTNFELSRYLDYCSELLSLTSKLAALYVQRFQDSPVLAAVNDVEELTAELSSKIWQKIAILDVRGEA